MGFENYDATWSLWVRGFAGGKSKGGVKFETEGLEDLKVFGGGEDWVGAAPGVGGGGGGVELNFKSSKFFSILSGHGNVIQLRFLRILACQWKKIWAF